MFPKILKKWTFPLVLCTAMLLGAVGNLHAFSVDVSRVTYSDPSRSIDYDFSVGTPGPAGDGTTTPIVPVNNILLPNTNPPVVAKDVADWYFMYGNLPQVGVATVSLNKTAKIATVTTTGGAVVLQGSSQGPPPAAGTTWTYAIGLKNFSGINDATKEYVFEVGFATPVGGVVQPQIRAFWTASGNLKLEAVIFDEANDADLWRSGKVDLTGLTTPANSLELKMVNNGTTIVFWYRMNGDAGTWTNMGEYTIASGLVFNSLPARFPYLYLEEGVPESPFRVSSQHWVDTNGNKYHAWVRVEDDQQIYSAVTVNSPGYLDETPMTFNSSQNYWSIEGTLFSDDFNDNTLDTAKWETTGNTVTESEGSLNVDQVLTDQGGKVLSKTILINPYAPIVVQRTAKVHYANNNFDGILGLYFGNTANFASVSSALPYDVMSVVASHANHEYSSATEQAVSGFYLGRTPAHLVGYPTTRTDAIWDTEFVEKIVYNPVSGVAELWINGEQKATLDVGALPSTARYMKVYLDAWGWDIGHYNDSNDLTVSQPWTGGNVYLSDNTPPALPVTFNFTATKKAGGTDMVSQDVTGYVTGYPTILSPTGEVNTNPVFSWNALEGAEFYSVEVSDSTGNRIWNKYDIPSTTTSYPYGGPALTNGQTYQYFISAGVETGGQSNHAFSTASFTYTGGTAAETISFTGSVKTVPSWPATGDMAALAGTTVSAYLLGATPTLIGTATVDAGTGAFTLTGIPKSSTFYLQVQPGAPGYTPVISKFMNWTADIQGLRPFVLFTMGQGLQYPTGLGVTPGTGTILGRVALENSPTTFLAGATIEARQWIAPVPPATEPTLGTTYPVTYTSGSATQDDGIYYVRNIPAGTIVQLVATLAGHTFPFNGSVVPAPMGVVSEESFFATPTPSPFYSYSYHNQDGNYFINLFAEDPTHAFTGGVTVSGPFLTGGTVSLAYNEVSKRWELPAGAGGMNLGSTPPPGGPFSYYFEAKNGAAEIVDSETNDVSVFVEGYATPSSPTGTVTEATPTFTWAAVSGATGYSIVLKDTTAGADIWFTPILPANQTSIVYNGTVPLVGGHAYEYTVIALNDSDGNQNSSFALGSFTYTAEVSTVTVSGIVRDLNGGVITSGVTVSPWPEIRPKQRRPRRRTAASAFRACLPIRHSR